MDLKDILTRLDTINEAANPAQQAAIAIAMKKAGKKPKHEGATGPKFTGYWKGTDAGTPGTKMVGSSESILRDLERKLDETPVRDLMREYREFVAEYGGVGGYGAASQAPAGTSNQQPDPADLQKAADATQIQKNTNAIAPTLNSQGAAQQLNKEYAGKRPIFLSILNGSFLFTADLFKQITIEAEVCFIKLASYKGTTSSGNVITAIGLDANVSGRDIIILEDIIDTGKTLHHFLPQLASSSPASIKIAVLLNKTEALAYPVKVDYACFDIPNKFVVGYGLDYDGLGRNTKAIYQLKA